jgi:hypothetical protein
VLYELTREYSKRDQQKLKPIYFDEVIDAEPFMEYWDDETEIEEGEDGFAAGASAAIEYAWRNYQADKATWSADVVAAFNEQQEAEAKLKADAKAEKQQRAKEKHELELKQLEQQKIAEQLAHAKALEAHTLATAKSAIENTPSAFQQSASGPGASPPPLAPSPTHITAPSPVPLAVHASGAVAAVTADTARQHTLPVVNGNIAQPPQPLGSPPAISSGSAAAPPPPLPVGPPRVPTSTTADEGMDTEVAQIVGGADRVETTGARPSPSPVPTLAKPGTPRSVAASPAVTDGHADSRVNALRARVAALQAKVELKSNEVSVEDQKLQKQTNPAVRLIVKRKVDSLKAEKVVLEKQLNDTQTQLNELLGSA